MKKERLVHNVINHCTHMVSVILMKLILAASNGFTIERSLNKDIVIMPNESPRADRVTKDTMKACCKQVKPLIMLNPSKGNGIKPAMRSTQDTYINNFCTVPSLVVWVFSKANTKVKFAIIMNTANTKQQIPNIKLNVSSS